GTEAVMQGEFFKYAGFGGMTEEVIITPDGQLSRRRTWSKDKWLGQGNRYQTHMVTQENDVIKSGRGEHGIVLYVPEMKVVNPK
ncbi:hypothetical protein KKA49_01450, partial [Patescibacteria group bacterium]|nr:hypothetical protein [Patescibacteria group bacterium]MBU1457301.1 hypothetical protein [Patescibacteria group bacterium]